MGSVNSAKDNGSLPTVPSIPLIPDRASVDPADQSIGGLVRDATSHLSTLVRAEVELAKSEVVAEVRKGVRGSVFFIVALTILLFSLFYFFMAVAELLADLGLYRSAAYGIVFLVMLLTAGLFAFLGYRKVRKIRAPQRTIETMRDNAALLSRRGQHDDED
ncbi:phage holin family protein [Pseudonocardiaceae bacterium YIM PH 21723]|nr:phage holin family protein [Pseudonocardiaceae bacterium YIM PH 21723]